jgi:plasmid maintenance system antidote protein VapI
MKLQLTARCKHQFVYVISTDPTSAYEQAKEFLNKKHDRTEWMLSQIEVIADNNSESGRLLLDYKNTYKPDYFVSPGKILQEYLESNNISVQQFSEKTGLRPMDILNIIKYGYDITEEIAEKLSKATYYPKEVWLNFNKGDQNE